MKISKKISFPAQIDMVEFMSVSRSSLSGDSDADSGFADHSLLMEDNRYFLFAVVNHHGVTLGSGHYTAYVRHYQDFWIKCDDGNVTSANLADVLESEGLVSVICRLEKHRCIYYMLI